MIDLTYSYIISPEVILNKYKDVIYSADSILVTGTSRVCCSSSDITGKTEYITGTTRYQMSMRDILSGGTNGNSLLTGLTLTIMLTQSDVELGFYTPFNGDILQKETMNNFLFSSTTSEPYKYYLYNTSDQAYKKYLKQSTWEVDWGDGTPIQSVTNFSPNSLPHQYPLNLTKEYTITLTQKSPWGLYEIKKKIYTPYSLVNIPDPKGSVTFYPQGGIWNSVKNPYNYIFSGDSNNKVQSQISSSYSFKSIPFLVTGFTKSRLTELANYGTPKYTTGPKYKTINGLRTEFANILSITQSETKYVIDGIQYSDYSGGTTIYIVQSSGLTSNDISMSAITKDETLLKIVDKPQVWSNVFIERGKNSAFEYIQRLGEVDNIGDLLKYGYGFFKVKS